MNRLEELNASAYSYYNTVFPTFLEICKPLFNLGIKSFGYIKMFPDGSYLCLREPKELMQKYFLTVRDQGHNLTSQIEACPISHNYHFRQPSNLSSFDNTKDFIPYLLHSYDIWRLHTIYENKVSFVEGYTFGMNCADEYADQFYLNYMPLLEHFCLQFQERAAHLIDAEDKRKLAYFEQQFNFNKLSEEDKLTQ